MHDFDDDLTARTLRDLLPEQLMAFDRVAVPGLGTFVREEEPSRVEETPEGAFMMPPAIRVAFHPEA
jgi:hypothetical protein